MAVTVLHVIDTLGFGGAERFLAGLVQHLDRDRFRPVVAWLSKAGPFAQRLEEAGIEVVGIHARGHRDAKALITLVRLMRELKVDVVNTHLFVDGFYGRLAALWAGVPARVVTQQNAYDDPRRRLPAWQIWANRALAPFTQRFVAVSQATKEYLHRVEWVPEHKIHVIPNAITPPPPVPEEAVRALRGMWAAREGAGPLVGTVARLEPQKGLDVLVDAMTQVREHLPDVRCVIVGAGALREALAARIRDRGLEGTVRLVGTREDIPVVLASLDVFVLPSRFEGLSLALLEAMAAGRPVVATAVSGTVEVVQDGETGILVPPEDAAALAQGIVRVLENREEARRLGAAARQRVLTHYTISAVARQYEALYEELVHA